MPNSFFKKFYCKDKTFKIIKNRLHYKINSLKYKSTKGTEKISDQPRREFSQNHDVWFNSDLGQKICSISRYIEIAKLIAVKHASGVIVNTESEIREQGSNPGLVHLCPLCNWERN